MDYRHEARLALDRAIEYLKTNDIYSIRYAALELRMSLEALIYQTAKKYKEELSERDIDKYLGINFSYFFHAEVNFRCNP